MHSNSLVSHARVGKPGPFAARTVRAQVQRGYYSAHWRVRESEKSENENERGVE